MELWIPAVINERGAGTRLNQQTLRRGPVDQHSCHWQFPPWNLGKDSKKQGIIEQPPAVPSLESKGKTQGLVYRLASRKPTVHHQQFPTKPTDSFIEAADWNWRRN